jgi:DNA repair exonuclease SbcCD ATPase subunit
MTKRTYDDAELMMMPDLLNPYEDAEAELKKIADDKAAELKKIADDKAAELKKIADAKAAIKDAKADLKKIADARASCWTSHDPATGAIWPHLRPAAELKKSADAKAAELQKIADPMFNFEDAKAELKKIADDKAAEEKFFVALVEDAKAQLKKIEDAKAAEKEDAYQKACKMADHTSRMNSLGKLTNCRICKERMQLGISGINICAGCNQGTMTGSSTGSSKWCEPLQKWC